MYVIMLSTFTSCLLNQNCWPEKTKKKFLLIENSNVVPYDKHGLIKNQDLLETGLGVITFLTGFEAYKTNST